MEYLYDNYSLYSFVFPVIAAILVGFGAYIGQQGAAKKAKEENDKTNSLVKKAIEDITEGVQESTLTLKEEQKKIIRGIDSANTSLTENLIKIKAAAEVLKNFTQNEGILLQTRFEFMFENENDLTKSLYLKAIKKLLTVNNIYDLKITSNDRESFFFSENNDFISVNMERPDAYIENLFTNSIGGNDMISLRKPTFSINYKLYAISLEFNLDDISINDEIAFRIVDMQGRGSENFEIMENEHQNVSIKKAEFKHFHEVEKKVELSSLKLKQRSGRTVEFDVYYVNLAGGALGEIYGVTFKARAKKITNGE